jgi:hypothetical protein
VRSWGLVRKWGNAGRQVEEMLGPCVMGGVSTVITAGNSTTSGNEDTEVTTACQEKPYKNLTKILVSVAWYPRTTSRLRPPGA